MNFAKQSLLFYKLFHIASSLWRSCPSCSKITLKETIIKQFFVCECGFHFDYPPRERFKTFGFKEGFQEIKAPTYMNSDPLKFRRKRRPKSHEIY